MGRGRGALAGRLVSWLPLLWLPPWLLHSLGQSYPGYGAFTLHPSELAADPVLARVSARVARLTGVDANEDDIWQVALNVPYVGAGSSLHNLHLDRNKRPGRVATVLMHLGGSATEGGVRRAAAVEGEAVRGGQTIFPCLSNTSEPLGAVGSERRTLCDRLQRE